MQVGLKLSIGSPRREVNPATNSMPAILLIDIVDTETGEILAPCEILYALSDDEFELE
jgi:hypothetical protein